MDSRQPICKSSGRPPRTKTKKTEAISRVSMATVRLCVRGQRCWTRRDQLQHRVGWWAGTAVSVWVRQGSPKQLDSLKTHTRPNTLQLLYGVTSFCFGGNANRGSCTGPWWNGVKSPQTCIPISHNAACLWKAVSNTWQYDRQDHWHTLGCVKHSF